MPSISSLPDLDPDRDALFLDIDGTLLDITETPSAVYVPPALRADLVALYTAFKGAIALISGRTLATIDVLFPERLPAAGAHGAEWRIVPQEAHTARTLPKILREGIDEAFGETPGLYLEDKLYSYAIHYRQAPEQRAILMTALNELLSRQEEELKLIDGNHVFEIIRQTQGKDSALVRFLAHPAFAGRRPIFLGDDATDEPAIRMAAQYGGIGLRVGGATGIKPQNIRDWLYQQRQRASRPPSLHRPPPDPPRQ